MATTDGGHVYDVTDATFERDVIAKSRSVPVLVDFWAPWCGPCLMLGPVIERVVSEQQGAVVLAKLNTDDNPMTAQRYGIRGIPNVKAFVDGTIANEFQGAAPEPQVRAFVQSLAPSPTKGAVSEAEALYNAGRLAEARTVLQEVASSDPGQAKVDRLLARIDIAEAARAAGERALLEARVQRSATDDEAVVALAMLAASTEEFGQALERLLALAETAGGEARDRARGAMLLIFRAMEDDEAIRHWQRRLAAALY